MKGSGVSDFGATGGDRARKGLPSQDLGILGKGSGVSGLGARG